ncbi:MAG: hypothetical protein U5K00_16610 [Melioribacteraceae bacterium]|nr:hypothetical protein [Melioribacteraceae bacterium]
MNNSKSLVYISDRELESHIYVQQINADEAVKITTLPVASYNNVGIGYDVSPDEKYIIYGHYDKLYRVGTDGRGLTQLATASNGFHFREVSYSDQGDKIVALLVGAAPYTSEIHILNANGSNMELFMEDVPGSLGSPSFSMDGTRILFTRDLSGNEVSSGRQLNTHVQLVKLDKSDTIDVSSKKADGTNDLFPRFSPNGGKIIFMNGSNSSNATEIWTMDSNGENRTMIHPNGKYPYWK